MPTSLVEITETEMFVPESEALAKRKYIIIVI